MEKLKAACLARAELYPHRRADILDLYFDAEDAVEAGGDADFEAQLALSDLEEIS